MAKILGICGSARKKGNTAALLQKVLASTGAETELIFLSDLGIGFCSGCLVCRTHKGACPQEDGMQVLLEKFQAAQGIVLGSPNYYYAVSGLTKNMIDRSIAWCYLGVGEHTGMDWHGWRPFVDRAVGFVITQAAYGGEQALEICNCFAQWTGLHQAGALIASVGARPVDDFPEYFDEANKLGKKMSQAVTQLQKGPLTGTTQ